jgi:single-stranded DNA-binding protein
MRFVTEPHKKEDSMLREFLKLGKMNTSNFIVKIISKPRQRLIADDIYVFEAQVEFPKVRRKKGLEQFKMAVWGSLGKHFLTYYRLGDYIIVEGSISFERSHLQTRYRKNAKLTVLKLYPFLITDEI